MRRGKTPLLLMEQLVMLLVFALAAALCLQAFVSADRLSRQLEARDRAAELVQSAAETLRHTGGDFSQTAALLGAQHQDEDSLGIDYADDWALAGEASRYTLHASRQASDVPGLGRARLWVQEEGADQELLLLDITWQEVNGRG